MNAIKDGKPRQWSTLDSGVVVVVKKVRSSQGCEKPNSNPVQKHSSPDVVIFNLDHDSIPTFSRCGKVYQRPWQGLESIPQRKTNDSSRALGPVLVPNFISPEEDLPSGTISSEASNPSCMMLREGVCVCDVAGGLIKKSRSEFERTERQRGNVMFCEQSKQRLTLT